ncbi:hypothetical protein M407DRAFT_234112 [Tulasnella calospora MUT 4182]|uniref:C2H2-type domain-containing protein n=1 Tax=Tulasnella calospora MUT 4182 TaxID=1051891 RepID=A0A0C3KZQ9_9AGAM|nr:hypothetical protein M407DRAFT_234112 [Tulasnella calospora MUT 4182]
MSSKRPRNSASSASDASKDSLSSSPPTQLSPKAARRGSLTATKSPTRAISCTLPPRCNPPNPATILASGKELEKHYSLYHTHVRTAPERSICGKVFPDARLLDLHLSECHESLIEVSRDRGERTARQSLTCFSCFVSACGHKFSTRKGRRLHLIDVHKYPKEYYFSVTAKDLGDILHRWR